MISHLLTICDKISKNTNNYEKLILEPLEYLDIESEKYLQLKSKILVNSQTAY